jgi:hypothetical protein
MTDRFDRHLAPWTAAIRSAGNPADAEALLECFAQTVTEDWPTELTEFEQLEDWTHPGLVAFSLAAKAPPGCVPEGSASPDEGWTPSFLITLRGMALVGRLAMACEQALQLEDRKTAVQMMRLMSREWMHLKGENAIEQALGEIGGLD